MEYVGKYINADLAGQLFAQRIKAERLLEILELQKIQVLKEAQEESDAQLIARVTQKNDDALQAKLLEEAGVRTTEESPDLVEDLFNFAEKPESLRELLQEAQEESGAQLITEVCQDPEDLFNFAEADKIHAKLDRIDMALSKLESQILFVRNTVECARDVAQVLHSDLLNARNQLHSSLKSGQDEKGKEISSEEAIQLFRATSRSLIMASMTILEQDHLSWGDFLKNLIKTIVNSLITVGSGFTVYDFFQPAKSTKDIVSEAELQFDYQQQSIATM
jgi:hypothetical protein